MSIEQQTPTKARDREDVEGAPATAAPTTTARAAITPTAARALAVLRIVLGFVFLWAFLDKTFGLNYSTPSERSIINGGSPTKGFLSSIAVGPLESTFHSIAGTWWADGLFLLGMLGLGLALILGIGLRVAAVAGMVMLAMLWFSEFPPARHTSSGEGTDSTNPLVDLHLVYAIGLITLAATSAGNTWGLGRWWSRLPVVRDHAWLR